MQSDNCDYMVAYARISENSEGIFLQGVYFGGMGRTHEEASAIAKDCVNSTRGGTILPKVCRVNGKHQVMDALYDAAEAFESITAQMSEANETIKRTVRR